MAVYCKYTHAWAPGHPGRAGGVPEKQKCMGLELVVYINGTLSVSQDLPPLLSPVR